jgi:hypothetical protein
VYAMLLTYTDADGKMPSNSLSPFCMADTDPQRCKWNRMEHRFCGLARWTQFAVADGGPRLIGCCQVGCHYSRPATLCIV